MKVTSVRLKNGKVTYWSVYQQTWVRNRSVCHVPNEELATMTPKQRKRVKDAKKHHCSGQQGMGALGDIDFSETPRAPCECGPWEKEFDSQWRTCGGPGKIRYVTRVSPTNLNRKGERFPSKVYEALTEVYEADVPDQWNVNRWDVKKRRLQLPYPSEAAAMKAVEKNFKRFCRRKG